MTDWLDSYEDSAMERHHEITISAALVFVGVLAAVCVFAIAFLHYAGWIQ